ncbi:MAG: apolipoprotein N-acyltransferase [Dethiobacteria bacterium]
MAGPLLSGKSKEGLYILLPLLSAALLLPAYPPLEWGGLAWFALIPLLHFSLKAAPGRAFWGGLLFGLPLHLYLNHYLFGVLYDFLSPPLAVLAMAALVLIISLLNGLFSWLVSRARFYHPLLLAFFIPSLWLALEYVRSLSFLGYNVGYLGYTQWQYPLLLNLVSFYGYWGLPFAMVAWQSMVTLALERRLKGKALPTAAAVFLLFLAIGLAAPELFPHQPGPSLKTALIQGNSSTEEILSSSGKKVILRRYLDLTRQAVENKPETELVVWPETVVELNFRKDREHLPEMSSLAEELGISILYGARVRTDEALYNGIVLLVPGEEPQTYYKQRLVPFVEYFPWEEWLNRLLTLESKIGSYTPGPGPALFELKGIPLAGVVCYESYFGDYARHFGRAGSRHLFVLTNDAWFGTTIGLEQHAQVAAIRAAELGIGTTQVANSGITISFDLRGRELLRTGKMTREINTLNLDLSRRSTFYLLAGDYLPWASLLFLAAAALPRQVSRRRAGLPVRKS